MTQTTQSLTVIDAKLEYSTDNAIWHDISGSTNKATPGGGERATQETATLGTEAPIVSVGRRKSVTLTISGLYTEAVGEAFSLLYTLSQNKTPLYVRYWPKGGQAGEWGWLSGPGYITSMLPPEVDANSEALLPFTATYSGPPFTQVTA